MSITISIPGEEYFDEVQEIFVSSEAQTFEIEHCLLSLSKWESIHHKSLLSTKELSGQEMLSYICCMNLSGELTPEVALRLPENEQKRITDYMNDPMTATYIPDPPGQAQNDEKITSELIYYWMVSFRIPFEAQAWPLKRLLALIKICNVKTNPPKVANKRAWAQERAALNAQRRAQLGGHG